MMLQYETILKTGKNIIFSKERRAIYFGAPSKKCSAALCREELLNHYTELEQRESWSYRGNSSDGSVARLNPFRFLLCRCTTSKACFYST